MIIKTVGMLLVFCAASLTGLYFGNLDYYRITDLNELKKSLILLKSDISYSVIPLAEATANISDRINKPISILFSKFSDSLRTREKSAREHWDICVNECLQDTYLNNEDRENLLILSSVFGCHDKDMQIEMMDGAIMNMETQISALMEQRTRNKKLFTNLGVLGGLLIVIITL